MEDGTKLMIYKNRKVYVTFQKGIPHISVKESYDGENMLKRLSVYCDKVKCVGSFI